MNSVIGVAGSADARTRWESCINTLSSPLLSQNEIAVASSTILTELRAPTLAARARALAVAAAAIEISPKLATAIALDSRSLATFALGSDAPEPSRSSGGASGGIQRGLRVSPTSTASSDAASQRIFAVRLLRRMKVKEEEQQQQDKDNPTSSSASGASGEANTASVSAALSFIESRWPDAPRDSLRLEDIPGYNVILIAIEAAAANVVTSARKRARHTTASALVSDTIASSRLNLEIEAATSRGGLCSAAHTLAKRIQTLVKVIRGKESTDLDDDSDDDDDGKKIDGGGKNSILKVIKFQSVVHVMRPH